MITVVTSSCSLGDKQAQADRITRSVRRLDTAGVASGEGSWRFRIEEIPGTVAGQFEQVNALPPIRLALVADQRRSRAQLAAPDNPPLVIFDNHVVYAQRSGSGLSSRDWARLDFGALSRLPDPSLEAVINNVGQGSIALLNPAHLFDLVEGALTGSIERLGEEIVGSQPATRFRANLSLDKAEGELDLSEEQRDARRRVLKILAFKGDVVPAEIWIGDDGTLRRVSLTFAQRPAPRTKMSFTVDLELAEFGAVPSPRVPPRKEFLRVDSASELVRGLRRAASPEGTPS